MKSQYDLTNRIPLAESGVGGPSVRVSSQQLLGKGHDIANEKEFGEDVAAFLSGKPLPGLYLGRVA